MSYTGTMVYYPASTTFDVIRDTLARRFDAATLTATADAITLAFDDRKVIRVDRDAASHVPAEAKELGGRADPGPRAALECAAYRVQIAPSDPAADPDDMYNELLFVFETLREMTDAVGIDPFDGAVYFTAAKVATKRVTTVKATKKTAAKRAPTNVAPTKAAATRPPKKTATKKTAPKKAAPKKATPKKAAPKKAPTAKKAAPKKASNR